MLDYLRMEKKVDMISTKSKEILDLSMSFDEKLQIVENPVSHELVAKLVA